MKLYSDKFVICIVLIISGCCGLLLSLYQHRPTLQPANVPHIKTYHYPASFVKQLKNDKEAGMKIYTEFCSSCHAAEPLIETNAPRVSDKQGWAVRQKMGMPWLLKLTNSGVGAMPARGGCFECSDQQLEETIHYLLTLASTPH
jgi:cytochrome c5